ncbi:MAG: S8 family serine peptidase, partial [Planctomycetales bacterium]|nr:S8 family serine peptidase [Planctomycetales bacterium]
MSLGVRGLRGLQRLEERLALTTAIIDSGGIAGALVAIDFTGNDSSVAASSSHAEHVADAFNDVSTADLLDLKVVDARGVLQNSALKNALAWVVDNVERYDIDVVNLSFSHPYYSGYLDVYLEELAAKGVVVVGAAGNGGNDSLNYPAMHSSVVAAMALGDDADGLAWYSQRGYDAIAAPAKYAGTSYAAPYIAAAFQVLKDAMGEVSREALVDHLFATADVTSGRYRSVNLTRALKSLEVCCTANHKDD